MALGALRRLCGALDYSERGSGPLMPRSRAA
jgi:hypothetical protein